MNYCFIIKTAVRLLVSVVIGSLIGIEREKHGRAAGIRTHILVCLGA
ncbi:MAG: MgtC/SapB family protein, partial [Clostridia bacterium]|nr:MgtC/SapB family protein [Clostridia bacterium]